MEIQGETADGITYHVVYGSFIELGDTFTEWQDTTAQQRYMVYDMVQKDISNCMKLDHLKLVA